MSAPLKIRPSSRLLRTIGRDLIKDSYAAIVELVKNSYDADSETVAVQFEYKEDKRRLIIKVVDDGHGMAPETVEKVWLVPATDHKLGKVESPNKRVMQGKKGIGRFAASMLGDRILLDTNHDGVKSQILLDMDEINRSEYLDQIDVLVNSLPTPEKNGTSILIETDDLSTEELKQRWPEDNIEKLVRELRSLITPEAIQKEALENNFGNVNGQFDIQFEVNGFSHSKYDQSTTTIESYPLNDFFDYRIYGAIDANGKIKAEYLNAQLPEAGVEKIDSSVQMRKTSSSPGRLYFDIRVFERDYKGLKRVIGRGVESGSFTEVNDVAWIRSQLNELYGVSLYRGGFRIRPYGDQDYDWLGFDKARTQKSKKLGHNQIIGYVFVENENRSRLEEKSARDGLVENSYYEGLKDYLDYPIARLYDRINAYKKEVKGEKEKTLEGKIDDLFDLSDFQAEVDQGLRSLKLDSVAKNKVEAVVGKVVQKEQKKKKIESKKIKEQIALYEGQATLGQVSHVLLHEGRKSVKYLSEVSPRLKKWILKFLSGGGDELRNKIENRAAAVEDHSKRLSYLFKKIEPLARTRRETPKFHNLHDAIDKAEGIYEDDFTKKGIEVFVGKDLKDVDVFGSQVDLLTIFSNLFENSIYWLDQDSVIERKILVEIFDEQDGVTTVEFRDSGVGFGDADVTQIFEAGYSNKLNNEGTGLGLTIAGSSAHRFSKGKIEAVESKIGACFHITLPTERA